MCDEILPLAEKKSSTEPATPEAKKSVTANDSKSLHDESKEKLVAIGELLGFDSRSEVKITTGAVVDAVWEAKIGNMGKAIYVFEVQSKGSIDSLILNLKKAQSKAGLCSFPFLESGIAKGLNSNLFYHNEFDRHRRKRKTVV